MKSRKSTTHSSEHYSSYSLNLGYCYNRKRRRKAVHKNNSVWFFQTSTAYTFNGCYDDPICTTMLLNENTETSQHNHSKEHVHPHKFRFVLNIKIVCKRFYQAGPILPKVKVLIGVTTEISEKNNIGFVCDFTALTIEVELELYLKRYIYEADC
ncbi:hypothetical protein Bhyg_00637 [Pseudolycoriella hygida]|uniref:Uncharacterized protein n=1 Tax=Pseudolycoriella hygida TaxID=35572 RepID=A0A9Q0N7W3_9DIPT|nr:hypothetical protein Bhyg_00637 [Pseudolycoriella hygida]